MEQELSRAIYGKSDVERVVCVEVQDDSAILFVENPDGSIDQKQVPNRYWILCSQNPGGWHRMKGELRYKWGTQYSSREEYMEARRALPRYGYDIFSIYDPREALCVKDGVTYFKNMRAGDISVLSFDIESTSLDPKDPAATVLIISNTLRKAGIVTRKMFTYDEYPDIGEMIAAWCDWVRSVDPSVICGHNIVSYDLPYLNKIADKFRRPLLLGRDGSDIVFESWDSKFRKDQTQDLHYRKCRIYGREVVDTMFLSIKHDIVAKKYESYALKKIIAQEGWEVPDRQHYDADQIRHRYKDPIEWEKIKKYALHDADDSLTLFDKMVSSAFYITQFVPKSFQSIVESASGSQINSLLMRAYLQDAHSLPKATEVNNFAGAFSLGIPGIYSNCLSFDVASLYPSVMLEYEVYDKDKDPQGYFIKTLEYFTSMRLAYKKKAKDTGDSYYDDLQNSFKILVNSYYGFMGARGLNFNAPDKAAFVTAKGRETLCKAIEWATSKPSQVFIDMIEDNVQEDANAEL